MSNKPLPVRVVVKLPYNRPENALPDPPKIDWTPEKADILWKVIELQRTRAVDSGGADWKGLAAHLEVPLPYLLYRVNARFQEEIRGLSAIQGALSPSATQPRGYDFPGSPKPNGATLPATQSGGPSLNDKPPSLATRMIYNESRLSNSRASLNGTPMGVRARLSSLTKELNSTPTPKRANVSSSILTLQAAKRPQTFVTSLQRPTSPSSNDGEVEEEMDSSDEEAIKEEEADRAAEEEEALAKKLANLQKMMTSEALGLVSTKATSQKSRARDRGRSIPISPRSVGSNSLSSRQDYRDRDALSSNASHSLSASRSASQSLSSASSPQGSIPEIPSPSSERNGGLLALKSPLSAAPTGRNFSRNRNGMVGSKSTPSSPPRFAGRGLSQQMQAQKRFGPLVDRMSEIGSSHGSEASSFSDLSDASLSASALEDAVMSNLGGSNASHLSQFTRSRMSSRTQSSVAKRNDSRSNFLDIRASPS
ncbi:hypothetical protein CPB83DRAFT_842618 [Crepidotus variabilis]|uniref:Autophagy-related protein 29 n=1 Tax=Crepidotus variabilis TaxID=179855 RepID=A0A9P6JW62_9AGAR|nr:hypothetical protein CPB83DRAFT_842618 [Crepidotus variabilis]